MEKLTEDFDKLNLEEKPVNKVGFVYHEDMLLHSLSLKDENKMLQHPENPKRLKTIIDVISKSGIKDQLEIVTDFDEIDRNFIIESGFSEDYVEYVEDLWAFAGNKDSMKYFDTYYNKHTPRAAKLAAQALKICVDKVIALGGKEGEWDSSFAAVRPPGHHAGTKNRISGFCFFNNIAVGATYASYILKNRLDIAIPEPRILIFDWDVHHGDSTQRLFSKSKDVLFMSFHRHDYGIFFPGKSGGIEHVGQGDAEGYCLNLAWNTRPGSDYKRIGDDEYVYAFERLAKPVIKEFDPHMIFISAGFDCHRGDPLGQLGVTQDALCYIAEELKQLSPNGKVIASLEGGYNCRVMARAVESVVRVFMGEEMPTEVSKSKKTKEQLLHDIEPSLNSLKDIDDALQVWSKYWPVLKTDHHALQLEKNISHRVEYRKHILGSKHPKRIHFNPELGVFSKDAKHHVEVDLWLRLKELGHEDTQHTDLFPHVIDVEVNRVLTKDYRNGKIPWRFIKLVLEPPHPTNVGSHLLNSDSEVSTDQENPEYFEKFYLDFAFKRDDGKGKMSFIKRKGAAFDFIERNKQRLEDHIDAKHKESLLNQVIRAWQFVHENPEWWPDLCLSLVIMQMDEDGDFRVLICNPNKHEGADGEQALQGIEEFRSWIESIDSSHPEKLKNEHDFNKISENVYDNVEL